MSAAPPANHISSIAGRKLSLFVTAIVMQNPTQAYSVRGEVETVSAQGSLLVMLGEVSPVLIFDIGPSPDICKRS